MRRPPLAGLYGLLLCLGLCCLAVTGCQRPQAPIKIGLAVNLSGTGGNAGEHIRDGALLAVEEINEQGGINNRPLQLLVRDDQNNEEGVLEADNDLIKNGAIAIIGHSQSSNTISAHPLVTSNNTILITAYTATTKLSGLDDLFLRTSVDCVLYGQKLARLLNREKARKVSVLMDMSNSDFVLDYLTYTRRNFTGELIQVPFSSKQQVDWPGLLSQLTGPAPDTIVLLTEATITGIALQKLADAGFTGNKIATLWAQTPELLQLGGAAADGLSIITYIDPENNGQEYQAFDRNMREKFHKPATARSSRAYEMVQILADALRRSESITAPALKVALLQGRYHTIMGKVAFDANGDVLRPVYDVVVKNGRFTNNGEID